MFNLFKKKEPDKPKTLEQILATRDPFKEMEDARRLMIEGGFETQMRAIELFLTALQKPRHATISIDYDFNGGVMLYLHQRGNVPLEMIIASIVMHWMKKANIPTEKATLDFNIDRLWESVRSHIHTME